MPPTTTKAPASARSFEVWVALAPIAMAPELVSRFDPSAPASVSCTTPRNMVAVAVPWPKWLTWPSLLVKVETAFPVAVARMFRAPVLVRTLTADVVVLKAVPSAMAAWTTPTSISARARAAVWPVALAVARMFSEPLLVRLPVAEAAPPLVGVTADAICSMPTRRPRSRVSEADGESGHSVRAMRHRVGDGGDGQVAGIGQGVGGRRAAEEAASRRSLLGDPSPRCERSHAPPSRRCRSRYPSPSP